MEGELERQRRDNQKEGRKGIQAPETGREDKEDEDKERGTPFERSAEGGRSGTYHI